jgi:membrane protease YdiL (CAAX protease family)
MGGKSISIKAVSSIFSLGGILFFIASPIIEEILYRALILKELLGVLSPIKANILTSGIFVGIHLPFWLAYLPIDALLLVNCIAVFIFSMVAGWLYIKSGSIWPSAIAHIANNILSSSLVISSVQ